MVHVALEAAELLGAGRRQRRGRRPPHARAARPGDARRLGREDRARASWSTRGTRATASRPSSPPSSPRSAFWHLDAPVRRLARDGRPDPVLAGARGRDGADAGARRSRQRDELWSGKEVAMALRTYGTMGVDWEQRVDFDRLRRERLARAKRAARATPSSARCSASTWRTSATSPPRTSARGRSTS